MNTIEMLTELDKNRDSKYEARNCHGNRCVVSIQEFEDDLGIGVDVVIKHENEDMTAFHLGYGGGGTDGTLTWEWELIKE